MKQRFLFFFFISGIVLMNACQKEHSFENNEIPSDGSLQSGVTGDCLPKTVAGFYIAGIALDGDSNYIEVQIDVVQAGSYTINTDTVNGIYFRNAGIFSATGLNTVRLGGIGTPLVAGIHNFIVSYDSTECTIAVTTLPAGAGDPAVFTLNGDPGTCVSFVPAGTYAVGTPLTAGNTVSINIDVTTIGVYTISTALSNGMTFTGTGIFATTGAQIIVLNGTGTPIVAGNASIPITAGASTCSFSVDVIGASVFTVNCGSAVVNGTYKEGVILSPANNTVDIDVNVTTPGGYSITGAINGMTFSASGVFASIGGHTITLAAAGIPVAEGTFNVSLTGGSAACNFQVTVEAGTPAGTIDWKFTEGASTFDGQVLDATLIVTTLPPPVNLTVTAFSFSGANTSDNILFQLADVAGGIQNNETYSTSATTTNLATFSYTGSPQNYTADPTVSGVTLIFTVTSHNTSTKTIEGTFAGTVKDGAGVTKTISNGTFKGTYP